MLEKFIENFLIKSRIIRQGYIDRLVIGNVSDLSEYKNIVGKIKGLNEADDLVRSLYKAMVERVDLRNLKDKPYEKESESY